MTWHADVANSLTLYRRPPATQLGRNRAFVGPGLNEPHPLGII
jgi:hypothetical protein